MLKPCKELELSLKIIDKVMRFSGTQYWLCFGGLWGLIMNEGTVPDGDLDICTYYGADFNRIARSFQSSPGGYTMGHAMVSDTDQQSALHCGFSSSMGLPHICLSFWYQHEDILYYCHDQHREVEGIGTPKSGYYFRGVPKDAIGELRFVEWPGISQMVKVSVPRFPGLLLDNLYPDWAYRKQRYIVNRKNQVDKEKMASYHKGGAVSKHQIHVNSMADFGNEKHVESELKKGEREYNNLLKMRV